MGKYIGKTILITGATGLIGSHLVDKFMNMDNVTVIALSRNIDKLKKGFEQYLTDSRFKIVAQDISEGLKKEIGNVDYIFHAASPMEGKVIANTPVDVIVPNLTGTINCLEYLKMQKKERGVSGRLILFSSVTVYGNITDVDITVDETQTRVTDALNANSAPYSQSKRMSEVIAQAYAKQYDVDIVIARLSTVYGDTRFVPDTAFFEFVKKALRSEDIVVNSSGAPRRDNIFVDDAVEGLLCIGEKGEKGEAYNVSSNGEGNNYAAIDEIAKTIAKVSKEKEYSVIRVQYKNPTENIRNAGLKMDNRKLKTIGWELKVTLEEGIEKTLSYFKKYDL